MHQITQPTHPPTRTGPVQHNYPAQAYVQHQHGGQRPPIAPGTPLVPIGAMPMPSPAYTSATDGLNASDRSTAGTFAAPPGVLPAPPGPADLEHAPPRAVDQPARLAQETAFCTTSCFGVFCRWMGTYVVLLTVSAVIAAMFLPELGLVLLSLLPAATLLSFLESRFRKSVIRMQMLITFLEGVAWMVPFVILENVFNYLLIVKTRLPKEGTCGLCVLSDFLQAFVIAGLFEETVKYITVRRVVYRSFVVDPMALVVYSCCAAAAFATVEDLLYNLSFGLATAIIRALLSVPLHCATGLIMGVSLADNRFFKKDTERW
jgi:RsiW-degrading membrane proteinase PrsW (M82 family)